MSQEEDGPSYFKQIRGIGEIGSLKKYVAARDPYYNLSRTQIHDTRRFHSYKSQQHPLHDTTRTAILDTKN